MLWLSARGTEHPFLWLCKQGEIERGAPRTPAGVRQRGEPASTPERETQRSLPPGFWTKLRICWLHSPFRILEDSLLDL